MALEISFYYSRFYNEITDIELKKVCIMSPVWPVSPRLQFCAWFSAFPSGDMSGDIMFDEI